MSASGFAWPLILCASLVAGVAVADSNEFLSTWKAPGAAQMSFAGRKVAAVLITDDQSLRVSAEEALAREITARGPVGVPAYRIIPREELASKDVAKGWFERAGVDGLVVLRLVQTDVAKVYSSAVWVSGYYNYAWAYWDYGWANVYPIGKARDEHTITVEVILFDVKKGDALWSGVARTTDPKDVQSYITKLTADVAKRLEKDGLTAKRR